MGHTEQYIITQIFLKSIYFLLDLGFSMFILNTNIKHIFIQKAFVRNKNLIIVFSVDAFTSNKNYEFIKLCSSVTSTSQTNKYKIYLFISLSAIL